VARKPLSEADTAKRQRGLDNGCFHHFDNHHENKHLFQSVVGMRLDKFGLGQQRH
jgi:hypothetical protein